MSNQDFFADIHCHSSIKAFHSGYPNPQKNIWEKIDHSESDKGIIRYIRKATPQIMKESQSHFGALLQGNVRVAQVSLTPLERGFLRIRNVPSLFVGKDAHEDMLSLITGFHSSNIKALKKRNNHYFQDLVKEYEYMRDGQGKSPDGKSSYKIVNNYDELQQVLAQDNSIAVIMSIEGGHVLGMGTEKTENIPTEELKKIATRNIQKIKDWEHPPFSLTLMHHFWNQLGGHVKSFKPPIQNLINQNKGLNKGLNEVGRHVIRELLSDHNGKRIILDTKHMSVLARKEYYGFVRNYNYINRDNKIPIMISHTGVNGYKDLDASVKKNDNAQKINKSYLHRWSINISDEEIRIVHESEGIIGLILDKGVLGGGLFHTSLEKVDDPQKRKDKFAKLLWTHAFQIIKAVNQKTAWDIISIGSDYDGAITHLDPYDGSAKFPDLRADLIDYLERTKMHKELWYNYKPETLVNKIMRDNTMAFLSKYFR